MSASPRLAAVRLGFGPSRGGEAEGAEAMLAALAGPDVDAARWPVGDFATALANARAHREAQRAHRAGTEGAGEALRAAQRARREEMDGILAHRLARAAAGQPFRERLAWFWADHFTVRPREPRMRAGVAAYADAAIRPHLGGRFADMLKAAALHPMMLLYLDQAESVGPNSRQGLRRGRGLNENLAREVLELHTLGVEAGYTQADVRGLARLFTGLSFTAETGFRFAPGRAEPGGDKVLGRVYGSGREARLEDILDALEDIAARPETARHLGWKLATHFVADTPDTGLVDHLAEAYRAGGGALRPVYAALAEHPATWASPGAKVRQPLEFLACAFRALGADPLGLAGLRARDRARLTFAALAAMGQPFEDPTGPDGWPEAAGRWITPHGLAARIDWAMTAPPRLLEAAARPDPRALVEAVLGPEASEATRMAAGAAETEWEGVGLVLASPEFNRR
ncbi:MAG: DUF1800 domain-containing protein [Rhodobacteraceae bacterium]|nr:DUF1800 domain-containing protein [Paracoccaceae bacterium]